jgi:hypothetical protein
MRRNHYFPKDEKKQATWLKNFSTKLRNSYAGTFGISNAEADVFVEFADFYRFLLAYLESSRNFCEALTSYKNTFKKAEYFTALPAVPQLNFTIPATIPSRQGMLAHISKMVARMKLHPNYNRGIGEDLGIEGSHHDFDKDKYTPKGNARSVGGNVELRFRKKGVDAMHVYAQDEATDKWILLGRQTKSPYRDKRPLAVAGKPEKRRYRLHGVMGDDEIGQLSNILEIDFGG